MLNRKPAIEYGIIGLGRFGTALASALVEAGKEIMVIDNNESKIKHIRHLTDNAFIVNELTRENLEEAGIQNCGTVIVCIGEKIDVSILTTLNVVSMGVPRVIAKAISTEQGMVLEKIGAEVIYPEQDIAIRLAHRLVSSRVMEYIALNDDISITELKLTSKLAGRTVLQADIRKKFNLNIIAIEHDENVITEIAPDFVLNENDIIVVIGKTKNINRFEDYLLSARK
ncbi:MAG: TrkA family potassium uptake protein [Clostridiales bacterium]|jgi:trk system potassium uptake protein TrkA|nr:TrkA family potassium uptake protein [Clostridiales bacterium]